MFRVPDAFEQQMVEAEGEVEGGIATARGLGVEEPKLTTRQRAELVCIHASGEYTIAEPMEVFSIGRATVHRVLDSAKQRDSP